MVAVIAANADNFRRGDRRKEIGGAERHGLEVESTRWASGVGQAVGHVLLGSGSQVNDPQFTGALLYFAVVDLVFKQEAAVFHKKFPYGAEAVKGWLRFPVSQRNGRSRGRPGRWK